MSTACAWNNEGCGGTPHCPPRCPRFFDREGQPYLIRLAAQSDRAALISMYEDLESADRSMGIPPTEPEAIERWVDSLLERGWHLIVSDGTNIVGHVGVVPAHESAPEVLIFVHQEYQCRGIGTELLKQTIAYARESEHAALKATIPSRKRQAIRVKQNLSFEITERYRGELELELSLEKPIADHVRQPPAAQEGNATSFQ